MDQKIIDEVRDVRLQDERERQQQKNRELMEVRKTQLQKELFQMLYNWGRMGVMVDENCFSYQHTMQQIEDVLSSMIKHDLTKK